MDGIEATIRFRKFEREQMEKEGGSRGNHLLIVGMSANSDDQIKQEAMNAGMNYFITKVQMVHSNLDFYHMVSVHLFVVFQCKISYFQFSFFLSYFTNLSFLLLSYSRLLIKT